MSKAKEFAVSDENGHYVHYTNDYKEAEKVAKEIDDELPKDGSGGMAAIMRYQEERGHYELYS